MKSNTVKRMMLSAVGGILIGTGVGLAVASGFGADAPGVLWEGTAGCLGLTVGQASLLVSAVYLLLVFLTDRKQLGVSTFINPLLIGLFTDLVSGNISAGAYLLIRVVLLIGGIALIGAGAGVTAAAGTGKDSYNALVFALNSRFGWPVALTRSILDGGCFLIGMVLGAGFKIGPVLGILIIGIILNKTHQFCSGLALFRSRPGPLRA